MHSFLCAMLFGMEKGRGRSAVTDAYSQYEPWHAPSFYAGALKFTVGQQKFYLERNFYSKEKNDYLRNELDGEELSVGFGDLTMLWVVSAKTVMPVPTISRRRELPLETRW